MPPNASPNTQTSRPQAKLAAPAARDHQPRWAASIQTPMPNCSHTAAAAAWIGWNDQTVAPQATRCRTQAGEVAAAGAITWVGRPAGIAGWACSAPSHTHMAPKPIRSRRRAGGSCPPGGPRREPRAGTSPTCLPATQASIDPATISAMMSAW